MATITVQPNQSMIDVILQATGSMEAGMQFCNDNGVSISDYPGVGTVYTVSAAALALGDPGALQYYGQYGVEVGTLNDAGALLNDDGNVLLNDDGNVLFVD